MTMVKFNPRMMNPSREMDRLFDSFQASRNCDCSPLTDILESDTEFELQVELPGFEKKDLTIRTENQVLILSGKREQEEESRKAHRQERRFRGEFERRFRLPRETDSEKVQAEMSHGLLTVKIPKSEQMIGREIEIS